MSVISKLVKRVINLDLLKHNKKQGEHNPIATRWRSKNTPGYFLFKQSLLLSRCTDPNSTVSCCWNRSRPRGYIHQQGLRLVRLRGGREEHMGGGRDLDPRREREAEEASRPGTALAGRARGRRCLFVRDYRRLWGPSLYGSKANIQPAAGTRDQG